MHMATKQPPVSLTVSSERVHCPALPGQLSFSPQVATCAGAKTIKTTLDLVPHLYLLDLSCMYPSPEVYIPHHDIYLTNPEDITMITKKRQSLQALLKFHHSSDSASPAEFSFPDSMDTGRRRSRSFTSTASVYYDEFESPSNLQALSVSPSSTTSLDSLIDDDPFADLSVAPAASRSRTASLISTSIPSPSFATAPKSPLSPTSTDFPSDSASFLEPKHGPRAFSYAPPLHARAAYQKPAFAPRPSLPSLSTLAKMNVAVLIKVRKGRVGAHLPSEPWNIPPYSPNSKDPRMEALGPAPSTSFASDFVSDLDGDFLDLSSPEDEFDDPPAPLSTSPEEARPGEPLWASNSAYSEEELTLPGGPVELSNDGASSLPALSRSISPDLSDHYPSPNSRSRSLSVSSSESYGEECATWDWFDRLRESSPPPDSNRGRALRAQQPLSSMESDSFSSEGSSLSSLNSPNSPPGDYSPSFTSTCTSLRSSSDSSSDDHSSGSHSEYEQHFLPEASSSGYSPSAYLSQKYPDDSPISQADLPSLNTHLNSRFQFGIGLHEHGNDEDDSNLFSEFTQVARERGSVPITPHASVYSTYSDITVNANLLCAREESDCTFEPGTSAGTIRAMPIPGRYSNTRGLSPGSQRQSVTEFWSRTERKRVTEMVDGAEEQGHRGRSYGAGNGWSGGNGTGNDYFGSGRGHGNHSGYERAGWSGSGGHGGDDGDHNRRNNGHRNTSSFSDSSELDTEEEEEESSTDDYGEPSARPLVERAQSADSDDDDVPLAKKIPTALKAQQSIRIQDREARERRRKERVAREEARSRQASIRPPGAAAPRPAVMSSSQEAALHASKSVRRPRAQTGHDSIPPPFAIEDLTRKLEDIQAMDLPTSPIPSSPMPPSGENGRFLLDRSTVTSPQQMEAASTSRRVLRPMRSFHAETKRTDDWNSVPLPADADSKIARSTTRTRTRALSVTHKDQRLPANPRAVSAPVAAGEQSQPQKIERKRTVKSAESKSTRASSEQSRAPPMPASAPAEVLSRQNKTTLVQQRIFIGDRQRFVVVEISPSTSAGEVIQMVEAQGALKEWRGSGGWMVFEIAQDFGMERPIRCFELLSDVEASWNKDKLVNVFLIKLTPFAPILSISALPTASPTHFGYVEWESKRGKWNKRYMVLREHCLWLSKREGGKDEVMLCSLSNFDVYQVTRLIKAPKDYTFAIKSTDNLSFFENTADYLHLFSCKTEAGEKWVEKILLARSYVLHQERNVLFQPKSSGAATTNSGGSSTLNRSGTRKGSRAPQPLVNVAPNNLFEPGSLLRH